MDLRALNESLNILSALKRSGYRFFLTNLPNPPYLPDALCAHSVSFERVWEVYQRFLELQIVIQHLRLLADMRDSNDAATLDLCKDYCLWCDDVFNVWEEIQALEAECNSLYTLLLHAKFQPQLNRPK